MKSLPAHIRMKSSWFAQLLKLLGHHRLFKSSVGGDVSTSFIGRQSMTATAFDNQSILWMSKVYVFEGVAATYSEPALNSFDASG